MRVSTWAKCSILAWLFVASGRNAYAADPPADPKACILASDRGQSLRDEGKYRDARKTLLECARDACPEVIVRSCAAWLRDLDDLAPSVVFDARDEQGNDLADVTVTFDGAPLASRLDGRPIEVDSGEHVLRFERAGSLPSELRLILRAGEKARVVKVKMSSVVPAEPLPGPATPPDVVPPPPEAGTSPRHVAAAALMLGAVLAGGSAIYLAVRSHHDEDAASGMRAGLPTNACTGLSTPSCQSLGDTVSAQHTDANVATGLFVGAGALAVGSVATWLFWPQPSASTTPTSGWLVPVPGGALLSVVGSLP
jgi:hypothetical protein